MSRRRTYNQDDWGNNSMNANARFVDFEFYTLDPNVSIDNRLLLPANVQTPVANLTINQLAGGDLVWLNGVLGLDNDAGISRELSIRIFQNSTVFIPGQEIFQAFVDLDAENDGDQQLVPLAHVDQIQSADQNVTYTVTVEPDGGDVYLNGPVTFTAVRIRKQ